MICNFEKKKKKKENKENSKEREVDLLSIMFKFHRREFIINSSVLVGNVGIPW